MSTSKRFAPKLKIKQGDNVKVIAGSNKGETGTVKAGVYLLKTVLLLMGSI
jgi:ribosomal protein L24